MGVDVWTRIIQGHCVFPFSLSASIYFVLFGVKYHCERWLYRESFMYKNIKHHPFTRQFRTFTNMWHGLSEFIQ